MQMNYTQCTFKLKGHSREYYYIVIKGPVSKVIVLANFLSIIAVSTPVPLRMNTHSFPLLTLHITDSCDYHSK